MKRLSLCFFFLFALTLHAALSAVNECLSHLRYKQEEPSPGMHIICAYPTHAGIVVRGIANAMQEFSMNSGKDTGSISSLMEDLYEVLGTYNPSRATIYCR